MRVALMVTCLNDAMFPETGQAVVRLLRRLGVEVEFPLAQTCCAQPMVNTGYLDEAVPVVRNFVDAFAGYDAIVTPSGSCAGSARYQHALVARRTDGHLVASASLLHDSEIVDYLRPYADAIRTAAIYAPLVVKNETGQRPCERQISAAFGRYEASAHSSNLGRPQFVSLRGARLADEFGWEIDPTVRPSSKRPTCIEVYPHPAMVSLFGLVRTIKYKAGRGRTVIDRRLAFQVLMGYMATHLTSLRLADDPRWLDMMSTATNATRPVDLKRIEDEIDAIFCAYLASLWVTAPEQLTVVGDFDGGYIVTPPAPGSPVVHAVSADRAVPPV